MTLDVTSSCSVIPVDDIWNLCVKRIGPRRCIAVASGSRSTSVAQECTEQTITAAGRREECLIERFAECLNGRLDTFIDSLFNESAY